jgi:intraflagellar transport protein 56
LIVKDNFSFKIIEKYCFYQGSKSSLQTRILFHIAHKQNDDEKFTKYHHQLQNSIEDQMCLASMHYMKNHYQEAIDIYKNYLAQNRYTFFLSSFKKYPFVLFSRDYLALNVYVALCYYKLDYYDISQELLEIYLKKYSESAIAINLQACNQYKLYNGKTAEVDYFNPIKKSR